MKAHAWEKDERLKVTVSGTVAAVCGISGAIIKFSIEICDNLFLKILIACLLTLTLISAFYIFFLVLKGMPRFLKFIVWLATFIFYFLLCAYVFTIKCADKPTPSLQIREGNIDNSIHNDNRKSYPVPKIVQRILKSSDIKTLASGLPEKNAKVLVQYLKDKPIDTLLSNQVVKQLLKSGYTDVQLSSATNLPDNLSGDKMTILKETIDLQTVYKVIINPQQ